MSEEDRSYNSRRPQDQVRDFIEDTKSLGTATKGQIAEAIGIQPSHLSNLLNGRNEWKLTQLQKLAEFLDVPLSRLFEGRNHESGTGATDDESPANVEQNIIRTLRAETRSLRRQLSEELAGLLREHFEDIAGTTAEHRRGDREPPAYDDDPPKLAYPETAHISEPGEEANEGSVIMGTGSETPSFMGDWLRQHGPDFTQYIVIQIWDESMEPALGQGSWVLVDRIQQTLRPGRIYALRTLQGLLVRRARRDRAHGWVLECDHRYWKSILLPSRTQVIGEVAWLLRKI